MNENEWYKYILVANTFKEASEYAAKRDWWLHSWQWVEGKRNEVEVYINEKFSGNPK